MLSYFKEYRITAVAAESIRTQLREVESQIAGLEDERDGLSGAEKGRVTRKLTPLKEAADLLKKTLKGAPPRPMKASDVYNQIRNDLGNRIAKLEDEVELLVSQAAKDPVRFIERGENVVGTVTHLEILKRIYKHLDRPEFLTPLHAFIYALAQIQQMYGAELVRNVKGSSQSTNAYQTAVERDKLYAQAQFMRWDFQYLQHDAWFLWDSLRAHYELYPAQWKQALYEYRNRTHLYFAEGKYNDIASVWAKGLNNAAEAFPKKMWRSDLNNWRANGNSIRQASAEEEAKRRNELETNIQEMVAGPDWPDFNFV